MKTIDIRRRSAQPLVFLTLVATACGVRPPNAPESMEKADFRQPVPPTSARLAGVRENLLRRIAAAEIPGAAVGVLRRGEVVWLEGLGFRDISTRDPATIDTPFALGSLSKSISSTALVLALARRGRHLDEPVESLEATPRQRQAAVGSELAPLTSRLLLDCRAGIPHGWITTDTEEARNSRLERALRVRAFPPGRLFEYSNLSFGLVDELIEQLWGDDLPTAVRTLVFAPLEMGHSGSWYEIDAAATPYSEKLEVLAPRTVFLPTGGGGYLSSASDLLRFAAFHLGDHRRDLFDASRMAETHRIQEGDAAPFRLGWWGDGNRQVSNGQISGSSSNLSLSHRHDAAVVVLVNRSGFDGLADRIVSEIEEALGISDPDPDAGRRRWARDHEQPLEHHREFQGRWRGALRGESPSTPIEISLASSPGTSTIRIGSRVAPLSHVEISIEGALRFGSAGPFAVPGEAFGIQGRIFGTLLAEGTRLHGYVSFRFADADGLGQATPWLTDLSRESIREEPAPRSPGPRSIDGARPGD